MRESFYHVACSITGATNPVDAERDVWTYFSGHRQGWPMVNARGERLGFWRDRALGQANAGFIDRHAADLVNLTDGSARSWAELFREALAIHGAHADVRVIQPKLSSVSPTSGLPTFTVPTVQGGTSSVQRIGILIKPFRWKHPNALSPFPFNRDDFILNDARFPWKLNNPADPAAIQWPAPDVQDMIRASHGTLYAPGIFTEHFVVVVTRGDTETWYDPSFGFGPHPSLLSYENELLGRGEPNPGGLFAVVGWKRERRPDSATGTMREHNVGLLLGAAPAPPGLILSAGAAEVEGSNHG